MKVLVTGGCGFLGSHVCELFKEKGWDVVAYDNLSKHELNRTGYNVEAVRDYNRRQLESMGITVQKADILNLDTLLQCTEHSFAGGKCDYIEHTAAQPTITIALEQPLLDASINIMGTLNVLEVARQLDIPAAICSTIHVYGNGSNGQIFEHMWENRFAALPETTSEDDVILTGTLTPLHSSKRTTEIYARTYTESYDTKIAIFRLTGIYGPRQFGGEDHGWVANFAIRTILGLPIKVFGSDRQVRDILYVKDAAQAFYDWFDNSQVPGVYNVGGGIPCITSICQCLDMLRELTNETQAIKLESFRDGDLWYFCSNISKASETFNWQPKVLPKEGITKLVKWIQENRELFQ